MTDVAFNSFQEIEGGYQTQLWVLYRFHISRHFAPEACLSIPETALLLITVLSKASSEQQTDFAGNNTEVP